MVFEEYEKQLYDAFLSKVVCNGSMVSMIDYPKQEKIRQQVNDIISVFYNGDPLTPFESDIEKRYISEKLTKMSKYAKRKSMRYKVKWTASDLNRF